MLENTSASAKGTAQSDARQVKALLRLLEDLGYDVETNPVGDWTVSMKTDQGDRTILGVDSAHKVAAVARELADSLQVDRSLVPSHALAH